MGRKRNEKHHLPPFPHSGILLVDKPKTWTSHDVVNFVRRRFNVKKVGHCGTLDPAATGLLVLVLGKATKSSQTLSRSDKAYAGTMLFGIETDSQDMDGNVVAEKDASFLTSEMVEGLFAKFVGEIEQVPPMVSAVKKDGKKLYELARKGETVEREPRKITVHKLVATKLHLPKVDFEVECSKGAYIRTLAYDIGNALGCGGVLFDLARTASGEFKLQDAHDVETMKSWTQDDLLRALVAF